MYAESFRWVGFWSEECDQSYWWGAKWPVHCSPVFISCDGGGGLQAIPRSRDWAEDGEPEKRGLEFWAMRGGRGLPEDDRQGDGKKRRGRKPRREVG